MKNKNIKPIETFYKGYRFRSRLEARWAIFFDVLGIEWEYEKEGYVLEDGICYLPDFWLPKAKVFVEIKGEKPTDEECKKCYFLAKQTGNEVILLVNLPTEILYPYFHWDSFTFYGDFNSKHNHKHLMVEDMMNQALDNQSSFWNTLQEFEPALAIGDNSTDNLALMFLANQKYRRYNYPNGYNYFNGDYQFGLVDVGIEHNLFNPFDLKTIRKAWNTARSARFEFNDKQK